tara:strand:+ start:100 stop:1872 length:1773 start_codon:yes stop_codon:yes gene_type:complete
MPAIPDSGDLTATPYWRVFLLFLATGIGILLLDGPPGASFAADIDDIARKLQIADLLRDGQWHDLSWPFLAMPDAYVTPWSRLVDAPYVFVTWLLDPFMEPSAAFAAARLIVPPLWFVAYAALAARVIQHLSGPHLRALPIIAAAVASLFALPEFYPGRIDHHNVQLVLMLALCLGLVSPHPYAGVLIGIASFLSVAVGLECAPFVALALVGFGLAAVWTGNGDLAQKLSQAGLALFIVTLPASLLLIGPRTMAQVQCDALSAPWIAALCLGGLVLAAAPRLWQFPHFVGPVSRLLSLAVPGTVLLAGLWLAFPACHGGPLWMIDPIANEYWFSRIPREHGLIEGYTEGAPLAIPVVMGFLMAVLIAAWDWARPRTAGSLVILGMASAALVLTILQTRNYRFPAVFIPLFVPAVLIALPTVSSWTRRLVPIAVPLCLGLALVGWVTRTERAIDPVMLMQGDACKDADFAALDNAPPGIVMAPSGLSFTLAEHIVSTHGPHQLVSLPFHRAAPSISRTAKALIMNDSIARREALAPFAYVAVCTTNVTFDGSVAPLYVALSAGEDWPGLVDVEADRASRFRLLRIDHEALR